MTIFLTVLAIVLIVLATINLIGIFKKIKKLKRTILELMTERQTLVANLDFEKDSKFINYLIAKAIEFKIEYTTNLAPTVNNQAELLSIKDKQLISDVNLITKDIMDSISDLQKERLLLHFKSLDYLRDYITQNVYLPLAVTYKKANLRIFKSNITKITKISNSGKGSSDIPK